MHDYVDPAMIMRENELTRIIKEIDWLPQETAEERARSLIRLRDIDEDQARQIALKQIHNYLRLWLRDNRVRRLVHHAKGSGAPDSDGR